MGCKLLYSSKIFSQKITKYTCQLGSPASKWSNFDEGDDLTLTGYRELMEEAFVFSLDQKIRHVPMQGFDAMIDPSPEVPVSNKCALGFNVSQIQLVSAVEVIGYNFNEDNRAYEAMLLWDISDLKDFSVACHEDWFRGGHSGIVVHAVEVGKIEPHGCFSGQQGFIDRVLYREHSAMTWLSEQVK